LKLVNELILHYGARSKKNIKSVTVLHRNREFNIPGRKIRRYEHSDLPKIQPPLSQSTNLKGFLFIAAPSKAALSHKKPASAETSH